MYLKTIELENVGPLRDVRVDFRTERNPKPMVLVGENGSGKSMVLAHVVNALISAKEKVYKDADVERGRVYKLRGAGYMTSQKDYSYTRVAFDDTRSFLEEWQLRVTRKEFEVSPAFGLARLWLGRPLTPVTRVRIWLGHQSPHVIRKSTTPPETSRGYVKSKCFGISVTPDEDDGLRPVFFVSSGRFELDVGGGGQRLLRERKRQRLRHRRGSEEAQDQSEPGHLVLARY